LARPRMQQYPLIMALEHECSNGKIVNQQICIVWNPRERSAIRSRFEYLKHSRFRYNGRAESGKVQLVETSVEIPITELEAIRAVVYACPTKKIIDFPRVLGLNYYTAKAGSVVSIQQCIVWNREERIREVLRLKNKVNKLNKARKADTVVELFEEAL
jgi:hypothetical protein